MKRNGIITVMENFMLKVKVMMTRCSLMCSSVSARKYTRNTVAKYYIFMTQKNMKSITIFQTQDSEHSKSFCQVKAFYILENI